MFSESLKETNPSQSWIIAWPPVPRVNCKQAYMSKTRAIIWLQFWSSMCVHNCITGRNRVFKQRNLHCIAAQSGQAAWPMDSSRTPFSPTSGSCDPHEVGWSRIGLASQLALAWLPWQPPPTSHHTFSFKPEVPANARPDQSIHPPLLWPRSPFLSCNAPLTSEPFIFTTPKFLPRPWPDQLKHPTPPIQPQSTARSYSLSLKMHEKLMKVRLLLPRRQLLTVRDKQTAFSEDEETDPSQSFLFCLRLWLRLAANAIHSNINSSCLSLSLTPFATFAILRVTAKQWI